MAIFFKHTLFFAALCITSLSFGQRVKNGYDNYLNKYEIVDELVEMKKYSNAIKFLDVCISFAESNPHMYNWGFLHMSKASIYIKRNNLKKCLREVRKAIVAGSSIDELDYRFLFTEPESLTIKNAIIKDYPDLLKRRFNNIKNIENYLATEKLLAIDQFYRVNKGVLEKNNLNSDVVIEITDELILDKCLDLVKKHCWNNDLWVIMWHDRDNYKNKTEFWNYMIPYINEQIKIGNLPNSFFARYEDYYSKSLTGYTIYGVVPGKVDVETINKKREEVFLLPLSDKIIKYYNQEW